MLTQLPRSTIPGTRFPAIPDAQAATRLAVQYQLEMSQWLSPPALFACQAVQLKLLLDHAHRSVPFYREMYDTHNIALPERITVEFMQRLPIMTRKLAQEAGEQLRTTQPPESHGKIWSGTTSGSTGQPVKFLRTAVTQFLWCIFLLREHAWHQRDLQQKLCAIRQPRRRDTATPDEKRMKGWGPAVDEVYDSGPSAFLNVVTPIQEQIAWLVREAPGYLLSYPSNLVALARLCLEQQIVLPSLKEVRTVGETLSSSQREIIRRAWNVGVVDAYTCEEAGYLALQCPESGHYHVQSENVWLEIVNEQDQPCLPGQVGRVLITTLHNFATPLIRYELGDLAEFGEACVCGRGLPVLRHIHGRRRNRLILPDGRNEFPYLGEHGEIEGLTGLKVHQFQCIQNSLEEVELKLVLDRPFSGDEADKVARLMQKHLGHPFRITFSFHQEIPKNPNGKFEEFISRVTL